MLLENSASVVRILVAYESPVGYLPLLILTPHLGFKITESLRLERTSWDHIGSARAGCSGLSLIRFSLPPKTAEKYLLVFSWNLFYGICVLIFTHQLLSRLWLLLKKVWITFFIPSHHLFTLIDKIPLSLLFPRLNPSPPPSAFSHVWCSSSLILFVALHQTHYSKSISSLYMEGLLLEFY